MYNLRNRNKINKVPILLLRFTERLGQDHF